MADYAKGQVLLELRKKAGLTRERAAADLGFTTKTLYTWEKEDGGIRQDSVRRLAEFYGVEDPATLTTSSTDGGDQLTRIEEKLDAILELLRPSSTEAADVIDEEAQRHAQRSGRSAASKPRSRRSA